MNSTTQHDVPAKFDAEMIFRLPTVGAQTASTKDSGQVRLGGLGPVFRIADAGKVRLGGLSPAVRLPSIVDAGKVRLGGLSPAFG